MADPGAEALSKILGALEASHEYLVGEIARNAVIDAESTVDPETWRRQRLAQTNALIKSAREHLATSIPDAKTIDAFIAEGYEIGGLWGDTQADAAAGKRATVGTRLTSPVVSQQTATIAKEAAGALENVQLGLTRGINATYRDTIENAVYGMTTGNLTRGDAIAVAVDDMARKGLPGFVDRAGRQWRPETYADMALRTTYARASTQGKLSRLEERGRNLVIISDSPEECPTCRPWEGKILAIKGAPSAPAVATVDAARSAGLWHPRCTHSANAYVEGLTVPKPSVASPEDYRLSQQQRGLERRVREARRRVVAAEATGDKKNILVARKRLGAQQEALGGFLEQTKRIPRVGADLLPAPGKKWVSTDAPKMDMTRKMKPLSAEAKALEDKKTASEWGMNRFEGWDVPDSVAKELTDAGWTHTRSTSEGSKTSTFKRAWTPEELAAAEKDISDALDLKTFDASLNAEVIKVGDLERYAGQKAMPPHIRIWFQERGWKWQTRKRGLVLERPFDAPDVSVPKPAAPKPAVVKPKPQTKKAAPVAPKKKVVAETPKTSVGNPGDAFEYGRTRIPEVNDRTRRWFEEWAKGKKEGTGRKKLAKLLKKVETEPISMRMTGDSLTAVLKEGRVKTIHEEGILNTFTDKAPSGVSPDFARQKYLRGRRSAELEYMGVPEDLAATEKPVYGHIGRLDDYEDLDGDRGQPLDMYGDLDVVLKDDVRGRATFTLGDSLNDRLRPIGVENVGSATDLDLYAADGRNWDGGPTLGGRDYIETQIHGGVTLDDIAEVRFSVKPADSLIALLNEKGIQWKISKI